MSDAHAAEGDAKPPKSKKMLIIIVAAVVLLGGGGAAAFFMMKPKPDTEEGAEGGAAHAPAAPKHEVAHAKPGTPPTFLPMESLVVNLADPGGERFAQIGITLEIGGDAHVADSVKAFMPSIRSGVLMVISQRTTAELLTLEGKEKLARDIRAEVSRPLGFEVEDESEEEAPPPKKGGKKKPKRAPAYNPIEKVLFSSFIVQ